MYLESGKIKELIIILNHATKQYDKGHPTLTDKQWDDMYFELKKLEEETGIIYPDSPTQKVFFEEVSKLNKVEHNHPMLSLDKTKDPTAISSFVKGHDWFGMFKMDGLTVSLTYEKGELVRAETRGNGIEGEDVWHNICQVKNIPLHIPTKDFGSHIYNIADRVIVDGEIICTYPDFEPFKEEYKNPRNFASGSIRLLNSKESAARNLTFVAWDLIEGIDEDFNFWRLEKLDDWGFTTVPRVGDAETVEDAIKILDEIDEHKIYPIDGYVFKFESKKYCESLGRTDHHFNSAIALKFYDEEYETELIDIDWTMGRTGILTPVAVFKPVDDGVSTIERASMHNLSVMRELLGGYPEQKQKIWVAKMNMIIPQVTRAEYKNNTLHDHVLDNGFCTRCPICGEPTEVVESDSGVYNIICGNPSCEGKLLNHIDHYLGIKGLNVKGISKATIGKLIDWGWINELGDIYKLDGYKTEWISKEGFGKASVEKILNAINASRSGVLLQNFLSALGIPLVGKTVAKTITNYYPTWDDFREAIGGDWTEFEGFGPEISRAINNFDYSAADEIVKLFTWAEDQSNEKQDEAPAIKDKVFCITGKVTRFKNRDELKADIESYGGKVVGSISSKVNYLINNDSTSTSAKNKAAKAANIPIITEEEYLSMKVTSSLD
jgi:DNA ligase (NAD+)